MDPPETRTPSAVDRWREKSLNRRGTACDSIVEQTVLKLNGVCKSATMNFALSVGRVVVAELFAGDIAGMRARNPRKDLSIRRLAKHPSLAMSPGVLYRSIAIFELCDRLGIDSWTHVSTSHLRLVLPLPSGIQSRLLLAAETDKWTTQQLDNEIARYVRGNPSTCFARGGRKRSSRFQHGMRTLERLATTLEETMGAKDAPAEASADSVRLAIQLLRGLAERLAAMQGRLEANLASSATLDETVPQKGSSLESSA